MTPTAGGWMYFVFALGGVAMYFMLPRGREGVRYAGPILGVLALAAWLTVMAARATAPTVGTAVFYVLAALSVGATARVVTHSKPFYSAIYFVLVVVAVAALLVLLQAEFLAISLIIIYAGAILVTYLFLIMLAQQSGAPAYDRRAREPFAAVFAGFVVMAAIAARAGDLPTPIASPGVKLTSAVNGSETVVSEAGNTFGVGVEVLTRYIVVLQVAGVLLLISMVGAVALSRKRVLLDTPWETPLPPLGEIGKQVEPY